MKLSELKIGEKAKITNILLEEDHKRRLLELGLIEGITVKMVRVAPMGSPMQIRLKGYDIAIRRQTAREIVVEKI